ncbi:MAG: DUF4156 domain-containing protein [Lysobacterales bacterium]
MYLKTLFSAITVTLAGCAAAPLNQPSAAQIMISRSAPETSCRYVGEVHGSQGNFWTAEFTKDENLVIGARNRMRNEAHQMGANYIHIQLENQSHNTADHSSGGVYSSVVIGNAFDCPAVDLAQTALFSS